MKTDERERQGDNKRENHNPEDTHVHNPALCTALANESLGENVGPPGFRDKQGVAPEVAPREKVDPTSAEIAPRRRAADPERVAIDQGRKGKNRCHGVADQGGVEVTQSTGSNENEYNEHYRSQAS